MIISVKKSGFLFLNVVLLCLFSCTKEKTRGGDNPEEFAGNIQSYTFHNIGISPGATHTFELPAATADVIDKGAVLGYVMAAGGITGEYWAPLPYFTGSGYRLFISAMDVGKIYVYSQFNLSGDSDFRFIVISGIRNMDLSIRYPRVDFNDYQAVSRYFGIPR